MIDNDDDDNDNDNENEGCTPGFIIYATILVLTRSMQQFHGFKRWTRDVICS